MAIKDLKAKHIEVILQIPDYKPKSRTNLSTYELEAAGLLERVRGDALKIKMTPAGRVIKGMIIDYRKRDNKYRDIATDNSQLKAELKNCRRMVTGLLMITVGCVCFSVLVLAGLI